ncbi:MAG: alpha/beta fold hydrolase [Akkermansiaceae bacterium]|nr:alpha/beta fold hydrolase [Akkermansiaceae bacterium]
MIQYSKQTDERRAAGAMECWCLHGAVGMAADWRAFTKQLSANGIGSRAVDLWRFLECGSMPLTQFAKALNADAHGEISRGHGKALLGYSMGGRLALHALLEKGHPWQAAVIVSAHPGLQNEEEQSDRRRSDAEWATRSLTGDWQEFLQAWNAQPTLGDVPQRDAQTSGQLISRRREIARSFVDWSLGAQFSLWDRLGEISTPVLWIVGEKDLKYIALAERAISLLPNASLLIAPSSGHRVPWEKQDWFAQEVSRFVKLGPEKELIH